MTLTPAFVLGTYHSGTTILYRMLSMHPDATWLSQFSQRTGRVPGRRRLPLHAQIDRMSRWMTRHTWREGGPTRLRQFLVATPQEAQSVWRHVVPESEKADPGLVTARMNEVLERESKIWERKSHMFIKDPHLARDVSLIRAACPSGKLSISSAMAVL
jgi:hypothetical protein